MNEKEAQAAYAAIVGVLRHHKFAWVVSQVEDSIDLGKTVKKKVDASEFIDDAAAGERRGRRKMQDFVTTDPYSARERLELLLDAIQRVVALPEFEAQTVKILNAEVVKFESEGEGGQDYTLRPDYAGAYNVSRENLRKFRQEIQGAEE